MRDPSINKKDFNFFSHQFYDSFVQPTWIFKTRVLACGGSIGFIQCSSLQKKKKKKRGRVLSPSVFDISWYGKLRVAGNFSARFY